MKQATRHTVGQILDRIAPRTADRLRAKRRTRPAADEEHPGEHRNLRGRVEGLERDVQELRRLNRRLADALDVMTELLVPAMDRDDAKVRETLARLDRFP
jgi:hypothetical protein